MKCPICDVEMAISSSRYHVEGDTRADSKTILYHEQDMSCRNKNCKNYKKVVETVRNKLPLS